MEQKKTKVFIVSGKARHGKDTTCNIIREIYDNKGYKTLNLQIGSYIKMYAKVISNWDGLEETKPRSLLQELGTEVIRKNIDELFFINRLIEDIKVYSYYFDIITVSDARVKVEIDLPKRDLDNVISIRINRPNFDNGLSLEQQHHLTEIDLDDYKSFDYILENDGTIEDLKNKIEKIIEV